MDNLFSSLMAAGIFTTAQGAVKWSTIGNLRYTRDGDGSPLWKPAGGEMPRIRTLAAVLFVLAAVQLVLVAGSRSLTAARDRDLAVCSALTRVLALTDLSIWTEARYARHPSLADRATAFQDHPGSLEHFPAGSVVSPPPHLLAAGTGRVTRP
jgi:hypothetical protein